MNKNKKISDTDGNKIWVLLNSILEYLEKDRLTPLTAFTLLVIIGVVRSVSESVFFEYPSFSMYLIIQHVAFNFPVLIMGVLILSLATDTPIRKVYNVVIPGFIFVIIPPFIDYYLYGLGGADQSGLYAYYTETAIERIPDLNLINMFLAEQISPGLKRMALMILFSSGVYISIKIKIHNIPNLIKNGEWRCVINKFSAFFFGIYGIWFVIWFIVVIVPAVFSFDAGGIVMFDYLYFNIYEKYYVFLMNYGFTVTEVFQTPGITVAQSLAIQQRSLFNTMAFIILSTLMMLLSMKITYPNILKNILHSIKKPIILLTTGSALLGAAVLHNTDPLFIYGWALDPGFLLHLPYIFYIAGMGFSLGCFYSFIQEYSCKEPMLNKSISKHMAVISLIAGGSFAFLMGPVRTVLIFAIATVFIYLSSRAQVKDFSYLQGSFFSLSSVLLFFLGIYTPDIWKIRPISNIHDRSGVMNLSRTPELDGSIILLMMCLFIAIIILALLPKIIDKMEWIGVFPGSMVFILLFLLPAVIGVGIITLTLVIIVGLIVAILMDPEISRLPMSMFGVCLFFYILDLWGYIPQIT